MSEQVDNPDVLGALVALAPSLAERLAADFAPLVDARATLRARLLDDGLIVGFPSEPSTFPQSMCAIDGGRVREQMYAADLLVAVASRADASIARVPLGPRGEQWAEILRHESGTGALVESAMHCLEAKVAADSEHEVRVLDGAYVTPFIALDKGLGSRSAHIRDRVAGMVSGSPWSAAANLRSLLFPEDPARVVLAIPKSDSASYYARDFTDRYGLPLHVSDRFLAAQVLEPGEMLASRPLHEMRERSVQVPADVSRKVRNAAEMLRALQEEASTAVEAGLARTAYFKPHASVTTGTVIRFEYVASPSTQAERSQLPAQHAALLSAETPVPHMMEPFCLWAVDRQAKGVSAGATALRATLLQCLPEREAAAYGALLAQDYRTGR